MTVPGGDFDAGKAAVLQMRCGVRGLLDQRADFGWCQRVRHRPGQVVGQRGGTDRFGVATRIMPSAPGILDLPEQTAILALHGFGETFELVRVVAPPHLNARQASLVPHHAERFRHRHRRSASGTIGVALDQAIRDPPGRRDEKAHRCVGDPVAQPLAGQLERGEQGGEIGSRLHGSDSLRRRGRGERDHATPVGDAWLVASRPATMQYRPQAGVSGWHAASARSERRVRPDHARPEITGRCQCVLVPGQSGERT